MHLENELVAANLVHRAYEDEFQKSVNGYKPGATVSIRKPAQFTVRSGAVASSQDVVEGTTSITIDKQRGIDFEFTGADLPLKIEELGERVLKPAMIRLANEVDLDVSALYKDVPIHVGTAGTLVDTFAKFARAPARMDDIVVPQGDRSAILSPTDYWGMVGSFTGLYVNETAKKALERASLPQIGGVKPYMATNAPTHTSGAYGGTVLVNGG